MLKIKVQSIINLWELIKLHQALHMCKRVCMCVCLMLSLTTS